jgi:hypothetical protein
MPKQPWIARIQNPCYDGTYHDRGEVTERLKVLASKASVRETVPWVRIPPSPPLLFWSTIEAVQEVGRGKEPRFAGSFTLESGLRQRKTNSFCAQCDG